MSEQGEFLNNLNPEVLRNLSREELVELIDLTDRQKDDQSTKFHLYQPTVTAFPFHQSEARRRATFGGNRASKTFRHVMDYAIQFVGEEPFALRGMVPEHRLNPRRKLRLCMDDYPNAFMKNIWPYIQLLVPNGAIKKVVRESGFIKRIENYHGGFLEFMFYSQDRAKFQGTARDSIGYDEEPPEDIHTENKMRLGSTPLELTYSLTPISGATKFLYDELYLKRGREVEKDFEFVMDRGKLVDVREGELIDRIIPGGEPDIHIFFSSVFENKSIPKEEAIRVLRDFPKEELIVRGKGHFLFRAGLVYKDYSEPENLLDRGLWWCNGPLSPNCTLYIAIDPHPRTPHAVLFLIKQKDGPMVVVDELFMEGTPYELAAAIEDRCRGKIPAVIICDPLAWTPDPISGQTDFASEIVRGLNKVGLRVPFIKATKDKVNGIMQTQRVFQKNEKGEADLYVMENCSRFRYEIARYAWDDWKDASMKGEKQKPVDKDDHMMENLYRLILLNPTWKPERHVRMVDDEDEYRSRGARVVGASSVTGY